MFDKENEIVNVKRIENSIQCRKIKLMMVHGVTTWKYNKLLCC